MRRYPPSYFLSVLRGGALVAASLVGSYAFSQEVVTDEVALQQPPAAATQPMPPEIPETRVEAGQVLQNYEQGGSILDGTIFDSPSVPGYAPGSSTTGSIIDVPDADLPLTVNVIPRDLLDDQIVLNLDDVVRNAGGVVSTSDVNFADRLIIRGQEIGSRNYRKDGFLDPSYVPRDFQNIERVEILKGPGSILYGAGDPSGTVNLITKKPLRDQFAVFGYTFGSWDRSRYTVDANGYGNSSGTVLYRVNIAQEDAASFVDFDFLNRTQIAPVVSWAIDDATVLTWNGEWHRHRSMGFQGTPGLNGDPLLLPPNRFIGEPASDRYELEEFRQSLVLRRDLGDGWAWSIGGYSLFFDTAGSFTGAEGQVNPTPPLIVRSRSTVPFDNEQSQSMIANLVGEFEAVGMLHQMVTGVEYNYFDSASQFSLSMLPGTFDPTSPSYTNPAPGAPLFFLDSPVYRQQRIGGYLQDLVSINDNWKAMAGVRFDALDLEFERDIGLGEVETQQTFYRTSPRAGLVYQPWGDEALAFYYSYAQSFVPPSAGIYLTPAILQPVLGETHEVGFKSMITDGLYLTACGFHTVRQNETFNLRTVVLAQVGEVKSQGAEINLVGELTERIDIVANYTYTDARLADPNPLFDGRLARNVPFNTANLWARYDFLRNEERRFGAAMGLVYLGERPADLENDLFLPGFTRWDGGLYYSQGRWNASLYLENLFDVQYAASSVNENQIFQGAPFNARAMVTYVY